jgi:hypothetical protein
MKTGRYDGSQRHFFFPQLTAKPHIRSTEWGFEFIFRNLHSAQARVAPGPDSPAQGLLLVLARVLHRVLRRACPVRPVRLAEDRAGLHR